MLEGHISRGSQAKTSRKDGYVPLGAKGRGMEAGLVEGRLEVGITFEI